jgi:hypothetical protein
MSAVTWHRSSDMAISPFGVRIVGFFQALLDLRSEPSVVLGAPHAGMKSRNNCEPGRSLARAASVNAFFNS